MHAPSRLVPALVLSVAPMLQSHAATLSFEDFVPAGITHINVDQNGPYREAGFVLTPADFQSAVFSPLSPTKMPGNTTAWLGFAEGNSVTVATEGGTTAFSFEAVIVGRSTLGAGPVTMTVTGTRTDGTSLVRTIDSLTTATEVVFGWAGLTSLVFSGSDDAGLDDLRVTAVPEPGAWRLIAAGVVVLAVARAGRGTGVLRSRRRRTETTFG